MGIQLQIICELHQPHSKVITELDRTSEKATLENLPTPRRVRDQHVRRRQTLDF